MSDGVEAGEPSRAPAPKRNWRVWGVWFGVALLFWAATFSEGYLVTFVLTTPSSLPASIPPGYTVALGIWDIVLNLALMPSVGYFVQQRVKSFDPTGIFAMTLAAGLVVGIAPMTIARVCTTNASPTCSYQFDLGMYGQSYDVVYALTDALNVSLVMLAGAFLSRWRRGAITVASPVRSKNILLAAWLVTGFVALGAGSAADAFTNLVFGGNYLQYLFYNASDAPLWYGGGVRLLSGPLLSFCLGYFLYSRLLGVGMRQLFSMVASGGMLAAVITQAAYGITLARMPSVVISTIVTGIFPAWIVLSGCLLSILERRGSVKSTVFPERLDFVSVGPILMVIGVVVMTVGFGFWVANGSPFTTPALEAVTALLIIGVPCIVVGCYYSSKAAVAGEESDSTKEDPQGQPQDKTD